MLYFTIQNRLQDGTSKVSEAAGARWRFCVRMWSDYRRISSWLSSNRLSIGGSIQGVSAEIWRFQNFVAGAVFGEVGGWLLLLRALEMTFHMSRRSLMSSFCVAGAVFGDVGGWLHFLRALEMTFHMSLCSRVMEWLCSDYRSAWQA